MLDSALQDLLDAVRRRLWRGQFVTALRRALWGSAALLVLAVALTLVAGRFPVAVLLVALACLWVLLLVWAARRRPTDTACALWADRRLGGASAFSTLLELDQGGAPKANAAALRRLKLWSANKAPECWKALAEQPGPLRLARPLLSAAVCAALAALVLGLSEPTPAPVQQASVSLPVPAGERASAGVEPSERTELANEIVKAVRDADSRQAVGRREQGRTQETANGKSVDVRAPPDDRSRLRPAGAGPLDPTAASDDSAAQAQKDQSAGTATAFGRDAGNSLDPRAAVGKASAPQGTMSAQGYELKARHRPDELQARMDQPGRYDEELARAGATTEPPAAAVAAATPPTATESSWLTPTETSYVQAWMKASARRR